jgi:prolyl-tRNA editing enzyme YbaK/EbsC (Cys-tRNA(Pro) deacylase)
MNELKSAVRRFAQRARTLGLEITIRQYDKSTRTAKEAATACGCAVGQIVKSLIFRGQASAKPYILLVSGANQVDVLSVGSLIGEMLQRPEAAFVREVTGFAIGGIPPLGHDVAIITYMDEDLLKYDTVWAAAGTPDSVFAIDPRTLAEKSRAHIIAVANANTSAAER